MASTDRGRGKNEGGVDPREAATGKVSVGKFAWGCFVQNVSASNTAANSLKFAVRCIYLIWLPVN